MKTLVNINARLSLLALSALLFLASCSNDDDNGSGANIQQAIGSYTVEDTDESDEVESYTISIAKGKNGSNLEISNFGDIMYVPVKANLKGNTLTIPSQTFKGQTMTIVISGQGTLTNNVLTFDYVIETDDDYFLEHTCVATKIE
jgi:hypothetical protein